MKKLMKSILIIGLFSQLSFAMANSVATPPGDIQDIINSSNQEMMKYESLAQGASGAYATQVSQDQGGGQKIQKAKGVMLFVSLGMPTLVLRQYLQQSEQYHIPVVIRGLLNNDYATTNDALYKILHPENKDPIDSGVEIDPLWFKDFGISKVPALVVVDDQQNFAVVYGNVPMQKLLSIVATKSTQADIKAIAQKTLQEGQSNG